MDTIEEIKKDIQRLKTAKILLLKDVLSEVSINPNSNSTALVDESLLEQRR